MTESLVNAGHEAKRPGLVTTLIVLTMTSGIVNLLASFAITALLVVGTLGIGLIICAPVTLLPAVLGIFEIIYAARLLSEKQLPPRPNPILAYFEIATILFANVIGLTVGIITLVIYNDQEVKAYFARTA